jgi:hypothetical protein
MEDSSRISFNLIAHAYYDTQGLLQLDEDQVALRDDIRKYFRVGSRIRTTPGNLIRCCLNELIDS